MLIPSIIKDHNDRFLLKSFMFFFIFFFLVFLLVFLLLILFLIFLLFLVLCIFRFLPVPAVGVTVTIRLFIILGCTRTAVGIFFLLNLKNLVNLIIFFLNFFFQFGRCPGSGGIRGSLRRLDILILDPLLLLLLLGIYILSI